jgi:hypothetical protein
MHLSSELYLIEPQDIVALPGNDKFFDGRKLKDDIVVIIGNSAKGERDALLKGRDIAENAAASGKKHVKVRFAFKSNMPLLLRPLSIVKQIRKRYYYTGSNVYHTTATAIREMGIERAIRTIENSYEIRNPKWRIPEEERKNKYIVLSEKMRREGFSDEYPLGIMLCRSFGVVDTLHQGHHRISICLENNINRVAVRFMASARAPFFIAPVMTALYSVKALFKRHK